MPAGPGRHGRRPPTLTLVVQQGPAEGTTGRAPARPPGVRPGTVLGRWRRGLIAAVRTFYFGRVPVAGEPAPAGPLLVLASHRNGAIDGFQVLAAHPRAQFLVSVQLLRNPLLRLLFTGIPVVRPKDVQRYGLDPAVVADPVEAGCAHLRAGGDLAVFPEGTSRWGHAPQPYRRGAARILCRLREEGLEPTVVPLGLHYSTPDAFRSRAEVVRGAPVSVPPREGPDGVVRDDRAWEDAVAAALGAALDAVSVDCPDEETFLHVQAAALARARSGESYAEAFLDEQTRATRAVPTPSPSPQVAPSPGRTSAVRVLGLALLWLLWPVLLAGHLAGTRADARNTVTFFRMAAGLAASVLWLLLLVLAALLLPWTWVPWLLLAGAACAVLGWTLLGLPRWRP